jgi:hypothetical protein
LLGFRLLAWHLRNAGKLYFDEARTHVLHASLAGGDHMSDMQAHTRRTWRFKSVSRNDAASTAHLWRWQTVSADSGTASSAQLFGTLAECVRDAQCCGFIGVVDPARGSFVRDGYEVSVIDEAVGC